mgnify:CR=1 FL=1
MDDTLDINAIKALLPHRYPFLLVDRVTDIVTGESAVGIKNVTVNEPFFQGHFPSKPAMPGVLILEAMAQTAGCLALDTIGDSAEDSVMYFMAIDGAKFRRVVEPGDTLKMHLTKERGRGKVWRFKGTAYVGDELACEATLTAMMAA